MKRIQMIPAGLFLILSMHACQQANDKNYEYGVAESADEMSLEETDSIPTSVLSSSAAKYEDSKRKFIRTADVEMEVKNVYESTKKIEAKVMELGGFVEHSNLSSYINSRETFPINEDSAVEVRKYEVSNQMSLGLPHQALHPFLLALGDEIQFLNHRQIEAKDVHLELLLAELENQRMNQNNENLNQLKGENGKTRDKQQVLAGIDQNQINQNRQTLNRLTTEDQIEFSTISLLIQEKEKIAQSMVINSQSYSDKYKPDFLYSAWNSTKSGFQLFQNLILGLLYIWPLWLIGILAVLLIKQQIKKRKTI